MNQQALFDPSGAEVGPLALAHLAKAANAQRAADACSARGWSALCAQYRVVMRGHEAEAECLSMLADFERLGGVA